MHLRDVQAGTWGPVAIPLAEFTDFQVRFEGAPIIPIESEFSRPEPGTVKSIDFVGERGEEIWLYVQDENENPIKNAKGMAWWGGVTSTSGYVTGLSRSSGKLWLGTFPAGLVRFQVEAAGYSTEDGAAEAPNDFTTVMILRKAGVIQGRCTNEGRPVEDFEITYWQEGTLQLFKRRSFSDQKEGEFELRDLAVGQWSLHASAPGYPYGKPATVSVSARKNSSVVLSLTPPIRGFGIILDDGTNEPIPTAQVQPFSTGGMTRSFPWGSPVEAASDGSFELDAFVRGTNWIQVEARGYARALVQKRVESEDLLDWGEIRLHRPQALTLQLRGIEEIPVSRVTAYSASGILDSDIEERFFDESGAVRYEVISPGDHKLIILAPDGSFSRLQLRLDPGKDWSFEHWISGSDFVEARILDATGAAPRVPPAVMLTALERSGTFVIRSRVAVDGHVVFSGIHSDRAQLHVLGEAGETLATRDVVPSTPARLVEIRLGGVPMRVHVVDGDGADLSEALVTVRSPANGDTLSVDSTDAQGWSTFHDLPPETLSMDITHGIAGRQYGIPVDARIQEHEVILEAKGALSLSVADEGEPLAGVQARIETLGGVVLGDIKQTDLSGLVTFDSLGEGNYRFSCRRADCWTTFVDRKLEAGEQARIEVPMRRLANLELLVTDPAGGAVGGQGVWLKSIEFGVEASAWLEAGRVEGRTVTDATGRLQLRGLPRGSYSWSADFEGERRGGTIELQAGANSIRVALGQ